MEFVTIGNHFFDEETWYHNIVEDVEWPQIHRSLFAYIPSLLFQAELFDYLSHNPKNLLFFANKKLNDCELCKNITALFILTIRPIRRFPYGVGVWGLVVQ